MEVSVWDEVLLKLLVAQDSDLQMYLSPDASEGKVKASNDGDILFCAIYQ